MSEATPLVRFRGVVSCRRDDAPLGLTLIGRTIDRTDEVATATFVGAAPEGLPEAVEDAAVERICEGRYKICNGPCEWMFAARSVHLHREVSTTFYQAITPRLVPWNKRLFWRIVLAMAASRFGRSLLLRLRRR